MRKAGIAFEGEDRAVAAQFLVGQLQGAQNIGSMAGETPNGELMVVVYARGEAAAEVQRRLRDMTFVQAPRVVPT